MRLFSKQNTNICNCKRIRRVQREFPGGKIEPGETPQQALAREIREELDTIIRIGELIETVEYDYPDFHLSMDCFTAEVVDGHLELKEAADARWLWKEELGDVKWLPADEMLVRSMWPVADVHPDEVMNNG